MNLLNQIQLRASQYSNITLPSNGIKIWMRENSRMRMKMFLKLLVWWDFSSAPLMNQRQCRWQPPMTLWTSQMKLSTHLWKRMRPLKRWKSTHSSNSPVLKRPPNHKLVSRTKLNLKKKPHNSRAQNWPWLRVRKHRKMSRRRVISHTELTWLRRELPELSQMLENLTSKINLRPSQRRRKSNIS